MASTFFTLFGKKPLIGMVHLLPLPGAPGYGGSVAQIEDAAFADLLALEEGGADAYIIENFGDIPYASFFGDEAFAVMSCITAKLANASPLPFGINIQANCSQKEWALAYAARAAFIRVETFVENRLGSFGTAFAAAPALMRQKAQFPSETMIFADIHTKHTFAMTPEQTTQLCIREAAESGAAALIATGLLTGCNPSLAEVAQMKELAGDLPVLLGSGISKDNAAAFFAAADGAIVGSSIKIDGDVHRPVDRQRVLALAQAIR